MSLFTQPSSQFAFTILNIYFPKLFFYNVLFYTECFSTIFIPHTYLYFYKVSEHENEKICWQVSKSKLEFRLLKFWIFLNLSVDEMTTEQKFVSKVVKIKLFYPIKQWSHLNSVISRLG